MMNGVNLKRYNFSTKSYKKKYTILKGQIKTTIKVINK